MSSDVENRSICNGLNHTFTHLSGWDFDFVFSAALSLVQSLRILVFLCSVQCLRRVHFVWTPSHPHPPARSTFTQRTLPRLARCRFTCKTKEKSKYRNTQLDTSTQSTCEVCCVGFLSWCSFSTHAWRAQQKYSFREDRFDYASTIFVFSRSSKLLLKFQNTCCLKRNERSDWTIQSERLVCWFCVVVDAHLTQSKRFCG